MTGRDVKGSHLWRMHLIPVLGFGGHLSEVWRGLVHPVEVCKRCYVMPQPTQISEGCACVHVIKAYGVGSGELW